jgi:16S rRNA (uracil1498-N3)-methyltransferase
MSRRRFYVPRDSIRNGIAILPPNQIHHLRNVLRMGSGDVVEIFDGQGNGYAGIVEIRGDDAIVHDLKTLPVEKARVGITLAAALIKSARFEWMLQKTTELGVEEIIPLETRFSEIHIPDHKIDSRLERWTRIVQEASEQCGRFTAPRICRPLEFRELLDNKDLSGCPRYLFHEKASAFWEPERIPPTGPAVLSIGPEGGWSPEEIEQAAGAGFQIASLGSLILRAETAAIAAVSILQHQIQRLSTQGECPCAK